MESETTQAPPWWPVLRAVLGIGAAVALGFGALLLVFIGLIVFTGCFWACNQPNPQPVFGVLLFALAIGAAGGSVTSAVAGFVGRQPWLKRVFGWATAIAAIALLIAFVNG